MKDWNYEIANGNKVQCKEILKYNSRLPLKLGCYRKAQSFLYNSNLKVSEQSTHQHIHIAQTEYTHVHNFFTISLIVYWIVLKPLFLSSFTYAYLSFNLT